MKLFIEARRSFKAFSLIELLIAIAVLAGIAAVLMPNLGNLSAKGRDTSRQADLKKIQTALEQYFVDQNFYPQAIGTPGQPILSPTGLKTYLGSIPKDPKTGASYAYEAKPSSCNNGSASPVIYCASYCLYANLEGTPDAEQTTGCDSAGYNLALGPSLGGSGVSSSGSIDYSRITPTPTPRPTATPIPPTPTPFPCSSGLLVNGCFEATPNGLANWSCNGAVSGSCTVDASTAHTGTKSVRITNTGGWWGWQTGQGGISASPSESFCLSGWARRQNGNETASIAIQEGGGSWREIDLWVTSSAGVWGQISSTVQIGADWVRPVQVFTRVWNAGQTVWFDDISLTRGACAGVFPSSGLIAYWKMDEVSGDTAADSVSSNHGNASGTAIVWGKLGRARRFTGNGEIIQTPPVNYSLNAMTTCAWTYVEGSAPSWNVIVAQWNSNAGVWNFSFSPGYILHYHPNGYGAVNGPGVPGLNNWAHLCTTRTTTGGVTFYRNGLPSAANSTAAGPLSTTAVPVVIGSFNWDFNQSFRGYIDEVGIWNRALTAEEISALYNGGAGRQP